MKPAWLLTLAFIAAVARCVAAAPTLPPEAPSPVFDNEKGADAWVDAGNLARLMNFTTLSHMQLPISVNLYFVGSGLQFSAAELEAWFTHLDDVLPHLVVADGLDAVHQAAGAEDDLSVNYAFSYHVAQLHPRVQTALERVVELELRREPRPSLFSSPLYSMRPSVLTAELESLAEALYFVDAMPHGYNLFILNMQHPTELHGGKPAVYGYRAGFTAEQLAPLVKDAQVLQALHIEDAKAAEKVEDDALEEEYFIPRGQRPLPEHEKAEKPLQRLRMYDVAVQSRDWANELLERLADKQKVSVKQAVLATLADGAPWEVRQLTQNARRLLEARGQTMDGAGSSANASDPAGAAQRRSWMSSRPPAFESECMVDMWVGDTRTAFIDLRAGPFTWGPVVGGRGVRTLSSLPRVPDIHPNAADASAAVRQQLLRAQEAAAAAAAADAQQPHSLAADEEELQQLREEREMQQTLVSKLCDSAAASADSDASWPQLCGTLKERMQHMDDYVASLEEYVRQRKAEGDGSSSSGAGSAGAGSAGAGSAGAGSGAGSSRPKRPSGDTLASASLIQGTGHEGTNASSRHDAFLGHLSAVISTMVRHVITPPVSEPLPDFESAFMEVFPQRVVFHLYVISNHKTFKPFHVLNFDYSDFKRELMALRQPNQEMAFQTHFLSMADDPALAVAYAAAQRSVVMPTLTLDGRYSALRRHYLSSVALRQQLVMLHRSDAETTAGQHTTRTLTVPIFLFSVDGPLPLFIDKHYQAKAVGDMVLAVQSNHARWESHLACNAQPIYWNLRNPLKATLMATVNLVSGLLPTHVSRSHAHHRTVQDWLWAVGNSPLAGSSSMHRLSSFNRDAIARSELVRVLASSRAMVNRGVRLLADTRTLLATEAPAHKELLASMAKRYNRLRSGWLALQQHNYAMQLYECSSHYNKLLDEARFFHASATRLASKLGPEACKKHVMRSGAPDNATTLAVCATIVAAVALVLLVYRRAAKAKIN